MEKEKKDLTTVENVNSINLNAVNLFDEKQLVAVENFLTKIIRSDKSGIKSVNDGLAILLRAKDLGLPFSTCIEHIHVINGKTGVDIHILKALLLKAGVTWKIIKDYTPLYEYTDSINVYEEDKLPEYAIKCKSKKEADEKIAKDDSDDHIYVYPVKFYRDVQGNIYRDYQLDSLRFGIAVNKQQIMELSKANKIAVYRIPAVPIDYVTEYEIYRTINGKEVTARGRFTKLEAQAADLFTKDTYNKYARILISHRAFTYAAREIASDIIMGVMETTELKIVAGKELSDEELLTVEEAEVVG